jgi:hypothetical protein
MSLGPYGGWAPGAVARRVAGDRHTVNVGAATLAALDLAGRAHGEQPDVRPSVGLPGAQVDTEGRVLDAARPDPRAPPARPPRRPGGAERAAGDTPSAGR